MYTKTLKSFLIFVFLFAVLERTGIELISFLKWQAGMEASVKFVEIDSESTSESEKKGKKKLTEFWLCNSYQTTVQNLTSNFAGYNPYNSTGVLANFYPSVPTPPPNAKPFSRLTF